MDRELVIVGAGISGLGFAHRALQRGLKPLLIESSDRTGGCIHTHQFTTATGPYWTELGGHTCYNSYGNLIDILDAVGMLDQLQDVQSLSYRLLTDNHLRSVAGALSILPLLVSGPRLLWLRRHGASCREFFGGIVGDKNYERVVGPALDALTCQPAGDYPADALFIKKPRRKEIRRHYTGPMGLSSLIDPAAERFGLELRLGTAAQSVKQLDDGYQISLSDGSTVNAATLVLAVAPDIARKILRGAAEDIATRCGAIEMAEFDSDALLFERDATTLPPLAGIIAHDDTFYSALSRDTVSDPQHRAFTFHFRPGIDPERRLTRACEVLGLQPDTLAGHFSKRNRLPAMRKGHEGLIADLDRQLTGRRLGLTGNWFFGVSIEDCLCRTAKEFDRLYPAD